MGGTVLAWSGWRQRYNLAVDPAPQIVETSIDVSQTVCPIIVLVSELPVEFKDMDPQALTLDW